MEPSQWRLFPMAASAGGSVLIADDETQCGVRMRATLEGAGYAVQEARDGGRALHLLQTSLVPLVVLFDHLLPGVRLADLLEQALVREELRRHTYLVLISDGYRRPSHTVTHCLAQLGGQFLHKTIEADTLLAVVAEAPATARARRLRHTRRSAATTR
ncbi:MAG TPA: response regulator [Ktedonobacterales bacterium]|nr:response regulator [Ktedonobacterales bacterium]